MDVHKNARTVPASRALLFKRVSELGWSVRAASEAAGISDRRSREWIGRAGRDEPLTDRSSRPHRTKAIDVEKRQQIIVLRRERRTMRQIARIAGVSTSTVARVCRAEGLSRLRSLEPPPPPVRYERERLGELLHVDTKRLGRFDRPGHRITRKRSLGSRKQGFEYVFVATDDHSRLSFARIYRDERSDVAARFLSDAVSWFARMNIRVERVLTDNGSPFLGRPFQSACSTLNIAHKRTRPYTPRTNGKVERLIQTLLREWAYRFECGSSAERQQWLKPYLHFYNYHRAHSSLGDNPPVSRLDKNNVLRRNS
ncbi:MAG TPA: IS481 family transposase [Thermoanaerobaculia bacterium]|nr:IS481 family transposase [Thermoanaerobaculia bacterium]